jgi:hypothetical protein
MEVQLVQLWKHAVLKTVEAASMWRYGITAHSASFILLNASKHGHQYEFSPTRAAFQLNGD